MGFVKAFADQPEHIASGLSPQKNIMRELQLRTVRIYPRFQEDINKSLNVDGRTLLNFHSPELSRWLTFITQLFNA